MKRMIHGIKLLLYVQLLINYLLLITFYIPKISHFKSIKNTDLPPRAQKPVNGFLCALKSTSYNLFNDYKEKTNRANTGSIEK